MPRMENQSIRREIMNKELIFLTTRPIERPIHKNSQVPSVPAPNVKTSNVVGSEYEQWRASTWSDTQGTKTPTRPRRTNPTSYRSNSTSRRTIPRTRTHSLSETNSQTGTQELGPGAFKVVITHANSVDGDPEKVSLPTLEVPIPHYRLGTPRFSARGTAFLHSSLYTRTSATEETQSSTFSGPEYDRLFPIPPGMEPRATVSRRHSHTSPQPYSVKVAPMVENPTTPCATSSPAVHRCKEPIMPAIFDTLASNLDDPAVVRYAPGTKDVIAGSPARIIAQITSKNFLDYELLSDFFLTVRAYLSTHDLLAYLLARFEWAINKFDDDGRVIRVRAFAALRHWILNYFPYDFVIDRDLRVKFCQRLNAMSRTVRERSIHGPSDLKLILDLKKCWNGRCALYWDNPLMDVGGRHDLDISPGGIAGSRDSQLTHPSQLWGRGDDNTPPQVLATLEPESSASALSNWFDAVQEAEENRAKGHDRQVSVATSHSLPTSPISEQSIQVLSCTLPPKGLKKYVAHPNRSVGAHPIPISMSMGRVCPALSSALSNEKPPAKHSHKRSGSFSDAARDKRTSMPTTQVNRSKDQVVMAFPYSGSLIRGSVIPPGSPYIHDFAPTTSAFDLPNMLARDVDGDSPYSNKPLSPGVKHLLGSIRRALSSKQSSGHQSNQSLCSGPFESKNSSLPTNVTYHDDGKLDRAQLEALKKHSRIDLLCADVTEEFKRALMEEPKDYSYQSSSTELVQSNEVVQDSYDTRQPVENVRPTTAIRNRSEVTNGSKSIFIVDDTGPVQPLPAMPFDPNRQPIDRQIYDSQSVQSTKTRSLTPTLLAGPAAEMLLPTHYHDGQPQGISGASSRCTQSSPAAPDAVLEHQGFDNTPDTGLTSSSQQQSPTRIPLGRSRSTNSGTRSLRKYASYQSGITRNPVDQSFDATTVSLSPPWTSSDKAPGRMLRRRPGGDLRANENVHDLEQIQRPRSTGSITTYTESMHSSGLYRTQAARNTSSFKAPPLPQSAPSEPAPEKAEESASLVRTRSSQPALRPSFEAAVAEFARIPDDNEGGIEATLLKLEGKYRRSPSDPLEMTPLEQTDPISSEAATEPPVGTLQPIQSPISDQEPTDDIPNLSKPPSIAVPKGEISQAMDEGLGHRHTAALSLYAESEESYNSMPLLERGLSTKSKKRAEINSDQSKITMPQPLFSPRESHRGYRPASPRQSFEPSKETYSSRRVKYLSSIPTTTDSFLLDEDEFLSDLSSEMSMEDEDRDDMMGGNPTYSDRQGYRQDVSASNVGNTHWLSSSHPPSPPVTTEYARAIAAHTSQIQDQRRPPTPEPSPVSRHVEPPMDIARKKSTSPASQQPSDTVPSTISNHRHLPFVLAFSSEVLAEQFTIIEKDALNEINWQDLIDMRWHHTSPSTLNWVDYLRTQEPSGIELVTARFNIIVKWALSQIVLTQNIEERALCIVKYIHIAKHARKVHNYATLLQLTIALTSIDCSRLSRTWELVPAAEKKVLEELETLITPIKNFHNLREEMETANSEEGCIPVVGKSIEYCHLHPFLQTNTHPSPLHPRLDLQLPKALPNRQHPRRRAPHQLRAPPQNSNHCQKPAASHRRQRQVQLPAR